MSMKQLLHLSRQKQHRRNPPQAFISAYKLSSLSRKMQTEAWKMFRLRREDFDIEELETFASSRSALSKDEGEEYEVGQVASHFLDSGSFTLWSEADKYAKATGKSKWDYYNTKEFWQYCDGYAAFVKKYSIGIDHYANVDVIPNAELSYRNLKYLEDKHGLSPVPVVHFTSDLKWLRRYIDEGYSFIALGGLVGSMTKDGCQGWVDRAFNIVCDTPRRLPQVRVHGFGVTNHSMIWRWPWWSVDSTVWTKMGAYGQIIVPPRHNGKWMFDKQPFKIGISMDATNLDNHYLTMKPGEKALVEAWIEEIGMKIGSLDKQGGIVEYGVLTRHTERRAANLHYFERMRLAMPEWPWAWRSKRRKGLGLK